MPSYKLLLYAGSASAVDPSNPVSGRMDVTARVLEATWWVAGSYPVIIYLEPGYVLDASELSLPEPSTSEPSYERRVVRAIAEAIGRSRPVARLPQLLTQLEEQGYEVVLLREGGEPLEEQLPRLREPRLYVLGCAVDPPWGELRGVPASVGSPSVSYLASHVAAYVATLEEGLLDSITRAVTRVESG